MPEIGDTLFIVLFRNVDVRDEHAASVHVTRVAAEQKAFQLRRDGHDVAVIGPIPATLEV